MLTGSVGDTDMNYWLPTWWNWIDNWDQCKTCLAYNGSPCASCEIPPGLLGIAQLVGGGTATVAGNIRGNATIASRRQAEAAARVPNVSAQEVNIQIDQQHAERMNLAERNLNRRQHR